MRIGNEEATMATIAFTDARWTMWLRDQVGTALSACREWLDHSSAAGCGMRSPRSRTFAAANAVARNDARDL